MFFVLIFSKPIWRRLWWKIMEFVFSRLFVKECYIGIFMLIYHTLTTGSNRSYFWFPTSIWVIIWSPSQKYRSIQLNTWKIQNFTHLKHILTMNQWRNSFKKKTRENLPLFAWHLKWDLYIVFHRMTSADIHILDLHVNQRFRVWTHKVAGMFAIWRKIKTQLELILISLKICEFSWLCTLWWWLLLERVDRRVSGFETRTPYGTFDSTKISLFCWNVFGSSYLWTVGAL